MGGQRKLPGGRDFWVESLRMSFSYPGREEAVRVGKGVEGNWRVVLKGLE